MAITGRAALLTLLGIVPAVLWPSGALVRIWVVVVVLLVALDTLLAPAPARLQVHRRMDRSNLRLGDNAPTVLTITNPTTRQARGLARDAWQPSAGATPTRHALTIPAGERVRISTTLAPTRRGDLHAAGVTIRLLGPLGLGGRQRTLDVPGSIRALHAFPARRHLPSRLAVLRQLDGRAAVRVRGQGTEFDSLRDWVDGDDVRSIDWRATARREALVVRTWRPEQHRRVVIVLDTSRTSAGRVGDAPRLDAAMDAALLLTALAGHAQDRVQVIAGDRTVRARVRGNDRATLLHETISTLAPIHPQLVEADWRTLAAEIHRLTSQRALVVLLTPLESAAVEEGLIPVLPGLVAHHTVVVASVADPAVAAAAARRDGTSAVYGAAAAERTTTLRARTAAALRRLGVGVIDAGPDEVPVLLADHYLALKRAGQL
ncbi:MAG: DUF58 domain-containing protein [Phycicoccus sp.]|nr:DUF58 domain-containing protein [Phycicoccus sp.]